ncbi:uncharacterized protein LOC117315731 [Pecten maximus]|uniref:uncharacterized protein LOC117315731 n=1 Tax=Pecten maximus TaxID=6579 RepID=UPI00145817E7|nr:uncharacterized protein LOC117315731 [Pecten maximus]
MQPVNMRGSPPDVIPTRLPYPHQQLLTFAGNDIRSYINNTDRREDSSIVLAGTSHSYTNQGNHTPVSTIREEDYSPPTPPRTPNHSSSAIYQQLQRPLPNALEDTPMRFSPLTVKTDLQAPDGQPATPTTSCVHSDPCSLTSPRHTKFHDDMNSLLQTKHAMERFLYETMERHRILNSVSTGYGDASLKPFPLKDPPKPKSKFKRQISTESNDPSDIKVGMKSPIKRLQASAYDEPDYTGMTGIQSRNKPNASSQGGQTAETSDRRKEESANQHPYAMNVKWIYSETDPSPKKEEDFTEISVADEISKCDGEGVERPDQSIGQSSHDTVRQTIIGDTVGRVPTTACLRRADDSGFTRNNEVDKVSNDYTKYRAEGGTVRTSKELSNEQERLSISASPRKSSEVSTSRVYDPSMSIRSNDINGGYSSDMNSSDTVRLVDYSKQKLGEDLHMMMSSLRNRDGRTTGTATTEMSHVTPKGFVFPPEANIKDPIPMSPRVVCTSTRPPFSAASDSSSRTVSTQRNVSMTSQRPPSMTSSRASLSRQIMPSPTSKEQPMFARDMSNYQREITSSQRRRFFHSMSDTDHSPSKQEIEQLKSLNRTISDPSCFSPSKKNMLTEDIIRMEPKYLISGNQYDDDDMSRPFSDEDRQYPSPQLHPGDRVPGTSGYHGSESASKYHPSDRVPGGSVYHGTDSARRQLFSEASANPPQYKHRVTRESTRDRIPDDIAAYLIKTNFCTPEAILSFNEKENPCPQEAQDYRRTRDWMMARHVAGSYRPQEEYNIRPVEEYVSRLQVPPQQVAYQAPSPPQRKRNRGEVDIRMVCEDFRLSDQTKQFQDNFRFADEASQNCKCANVEKEILEMAHDAFRKIRRKDDSSEAFEQFGKEVQETRARISQAFDILNGVKAICKHERTIVDMFSGSVIFRVRCPTVLALDDLWNSYQSGELTSTINRHFISDGLRAKYSDMDIGLVVTITEEQYRRARRELDTILSPGRLDSSLSKSDTEIASITGDSVKENVGCAKVLSSASRLGIIHSRCQSAPVTHSPSPASSPSWLPKSPMSPLGGDRKFTFPGEPSSRRIFQERNKGSCSPTMKKLFDFELSLSPKTSPKRKTFAEGFPRENVHPEVHSPKRKNNGTSFPFKDKSNDVET